jgi:hypothetical protein
MLKFLYVIYGMVILGGSVLGVVTSTASTTSTGSGWFSHSGGSSWGGSHGSTGGFSSGGSHK